MASSNDKDSLLRLIREGQPLSFAQQLQLTFQLSLPAILANASAMVMQLIDAAMVGQLGANDSASVGLMGSTSWLFEGVLSAFAAGYAVQVAHLLGAKRNSDARQVVRQAIVVCVLFSLLLAGFGLLICKPLPIWLGAAPQICPNATIYFGTFMLFVPFFMLDIVASSLLRSSGNIEQDADIVLLLHRVEAENDPVLNQPSFKEYKGWVTVSELAKRDLQLIMVHVAKNRSGAVGTAWSAFQAKAMRFMTLEDAMVGGVFG